MLPDEAAWIRDNVLHVLSFSIAHGSGHLDTACSPIPGSGRRCFNCFTHGGERPQEHTCRHGRPESEGRLRVANRFPSPRGCRLPDEPIPGEIWLAGRTCRTYCTCPCRQAPAPTLFDTEGR